MKRIALMAAVLVLASSAAYAHCGNCPGDKAKKPEGKDCALKVEKKVEKITEKLGLSAEQAEKVKPLVEEKYGKKKAVKQECRAKQKVIGEEFSAKLKALLNDEQKVKFAEWKKEWKEEKGECGCKGHGKGKEGDCPYHKKGHKGGGEKAEKE